MKPSIMEFVTDPQLLGLSVSPAQETLLRTMYGLPVGKDHLTLFRDCTGRAAPPAQPFGEVAVIAGARAGKDSRIAAPVVCYEAEFGDHQRYLARGERGVIVLVAQDLKGTRVAFGYVKDYLTRSTVLASTIAEVLASEIMLTNGITISCFPSTMRSLRGHTIPVGVMDELAFYRLEGAADSDAEIQASIRRGMIGFPAPRLIKISTPYMKSGVLYEDLKSAWGQDNPDLLVWKASTVLMNPTITAKRLERERRLDPVRFAREFEAEFAEDVDAFLPAACVDDAVVAGRHELPPMVGVPYVAAVDPSGGGADAFTLAIVHVEGDRAQRRVVHDVMKGWAHVGSQLTGVVQEIAQTLRLHGLREVRGDRYAAGWVRQAFQEAGIMYRDAELDKSAAYLEAEPLFAQGRIELLDHPQLGRELKNLERHPHAGGRTVVDHPRGGTDDYANSLCLSAAQTISKAASARPASGRVPPGPVPGVTLPRGWGREWTRW
jgi:hypothetical protein